MLTRKKLDHMGCSAPDCTEDHGPQPIGARLTLWATCCQVPLLRAVYLHGTGELHLACGACERPVGTVAVGEADAPSPF